VENVASWSARRSMRLSLSATARVPSKSDYNGIGMSADGTAVLSLILLMDLVTLTLVLMLEPSLVSTRS
jgi:hypothetical protein